jgi:hypothetical protein
MCTEAMHASTTSRLEWKVSRRRGRRKGSVVTHTWTRPVHLPRREPIWVSVWIRVCRDQFILGHNHRAEGIVLLLRRPQRLIQDEGGSESSRLFFNRGRDMSHPPGVTG